MQWFIVSRDMHVLCAPSTKAPNSISIYNDKQTISITNNAVVSTYEFTINQKHPDAKYFLLGNYIAFRDKYGDTKLYTMKEHHGDDLQQTWTCEDIGMDLINATADKWDYSKDPHPIAWYYENLVLKDTGWTLGVNEISNLSRGLSFDGQSDTLLTRAGDIANQFDGAEINFTVEMSGSQVISQNVNIYKKIGSGATKEKFIDQKNLTSLNYNGTIDNLCTSLIGYGGTPESTGDNTSEKPPIDISDLAYDDGQFWTVKGDKHLYDRISHKTWTRFRAYYDSSSKSTDGYINGIFTYDTTDPQELLKRMITELKSRNHPSETYEATLLKLGADIGDYIQIAHNNYNPPIYLNARVQQVENCYTAEGQDIGILGDYTRMQSNIDPRVQQLIDGLANSVKSNYTWIRYAKDDKGTDMTATPTTDTKYVAIVSNKPTGVPSDDPAEYAGHWQLIKGSDGKDGIPGATGADGKTSYTHFAYADNVSGTADFSLDDPTGRSYMGVYSDFTKADSTNPDDYIWSFTKGETGPEGMQGIPGKPGIDGKTPYTHVAYADNDEGGGFSQLPANKAYMGWYTDFTQVDSTDTTKYAWSLIKGRDGSNGAPGKAGTDGKTPYFHQAWADSKDGKINFSTTDPTNRGYLGTYSDFTQADSTDPAKYTWTELVGALSIGGRNYLKGSDTVVQLHGVTQAYPNGVWANTWYAMFQPIQRYAEDVWVFSTDYIPIAPTPAQPKLAVGVMNHEDTSLFTILGDFPVINGRLVAAIDLSKVDKRFDSIIVYSSHSGWGDSIDKKAQFNHYQMERATKVSDWQPAPEDTQQQIDTINQGLLDTNSKIAAVTKVDSQATAPTNPKKGDQWWVKDANGNINAFKIWDGTKWADSIIQQSAMNISTLNGNVINGATINSSNFNVSYDETKENSGRPLGPYFKGTQIIKNGSYLSDYQVKGSSQTGYSHITPDGITTRINDSNGKPLSQASLVRGAIELQDQNYSGYLNAEDLVRIGPEEWTNSDDAGNRFTMQFERRWGRVWVTGEFIIPYAKFGTGGDGYRTLFRLNTAGLRPRVNRYISGIRVGDVPSLGMLEVRPSGDVVAIGVPNGGRTSFEGISFAID